MGEWCCHGWSRWSARVIASGAVIACAPPKSEQPQPASPRLAPADVERLIAGGDPFEMAEEWTAAVRPDVRFVEYARSPAIEGEHALGDYLRSVARARARGSRRPVRVFQLAGDRRVVETLVLDDDQRVIGAALLYVRLGDGLVAEMRSYGRPEPWSTDAELPDAPDGPPEVIGDGHDSGSVATMRAWLEAEADGELGATTAFFEPAAAPVEVSGVVLPPGQRWDVESITHDDVVGSGSWVAALSRIAVVREPQDVPVTIHRALVARVEGESVAETHVYLDPLELGPVAMGFRRLKTTDDLAENATGGKVFGPLRPWCCRPSGADADQCWMLDARSAGRCDRPGWNEYECRHRHGCVGDNCFCCVSEVDAACEPEPKREPERERWVPRSRRPAQGTVWSPY